MTPAHPLPTVCPPEQLPECQRIFAALEKRLDRFEVEQVQQGKDLAVIGTKLTIYAALGGVGGGVVTGLIVSVITHAMR